MSLNHPSSPSMTLTPPYSTHHTAIHEAGHFVAAKVQGRHEDTYSVSIEPGSDKGLLYGGSVSGAYPDLSSVKDFDAALITLYAGLAAVLHGAPEVREVAKERAEDDDKQADVLIDIAKLPHDETESRLRARAAALVAEHWSLVEALAEDLLENGTISGDEATWVLEAAGGDQGAAESLVFFRAFNNTSEADGDR